MAEHLGQHLYELIKAAVLYANRGVLPGPFSAAVLSNDLFGAVEQASRKDYICMPDFVRFIKERMPRSSWGAPTLVGLWVEVGGLAGVSMPLLPDDPFCLHMYSLSKEVRDAAYEHEMAPAREAFRRGMDEITEMEQAIHQDIQEILNPKEEK